MKILLVGLGGAGQRHLRNLRTLLGSEVELVAWRQRGQPFVITETFSLDQRQTVDEAYDLTCYNHLEDALATRPDAAIVATPSSMHIEPALAAAEAGCHLLIEKPLAASEQGVTELIEVVRRNRRAAVIAFQMRFHPCTLAVRRMLEQGLLGRIMSARVEAGSFLPDWHPYEDYRQLYAARADLGGGVLLTEIHELDLLYSFFGMPQRLSAAGGPLGELGLSEVEDTAALLLTFAPDGREFPASVHLSFAQRPAARGGVIRGTAGTVEWDYLNARVRLYRVGHTDWEAFEFPGFQRNHMFLDLLRHFLACVRGEATPVVGLEDGLRTLRIALAARAALNSGTPVELAA